MTIEDKNIKSILLDKPAEKDLFNLTNYKDAFKKIVTECDTPMTISIQGEWGSGKTSFVTQVLDDLDDNSKEIQTITFNTWKYAQFNGSENLTTIFLKEFADEIMGDNIESLKDKEEIKKLISNFFIMTEQIPLFNESKTGKIITVANNYFNKKIKKDSNIVSEVNKITELLNTYTEKKKRVIIFIDDLDRIAPSKVINILEMLQNILTLDNCVFILAVDKDVIVQGFKDTRGSGYTTSKSEDFFDKIIQLPFTLPNLNKEKSEEFIKQLLIKTLDNDSLYQEFIDIIDISVKYNPRKIKRLMNYYLFLKNVNPDRNDDIYNVALFYILCAQTEFKNLYQFFDINSNEFKFISDIYTNSDFIYNLTETITQDDEEISVQSLEEFLNHFKTVFPYDQEPEKLFKEVISLSQSTRDTTRTKKLQGSMGAFVKSTIPNLKLTQEIFNKLCTREYTRENFKSSVPMFRDVTGKTENDIFDNERFYTLDKKSDYARYYKEIFETTLIDTDEKRIFLVSSQWGNDQHKDYITWMNSL